MKPRVLSRKMTLVLEAFGRHLGLPSDEFWAKMADDSEDADFDRIFAEVFHPLSLTSAPIRTKDRDVNQAEMRGRRTIVGRPMENDHPFAAWLRGQNLTLTEWAFRNGFKRERVKSWITDGAGGRPIPRDAADKIAAEATPEGAKRSALPATAKTWPNGIKE